MISPNGIIETAGQNELDKNSPPDRNRNATRYRQNRLPPSPESKSAYTVETGKVANRTVNGKGKILAVRLED